MIWDEELSISVNQVPLKQKAALTIQLFHRVFSDTDYVALLPHGDEPVYLPGKEEGEMHRIIFRDDHLPSALHEISHWCMAGAFRRKQSDYGYDYRPPPRNQASQSLFQSVEVKPQALEWLLHSAIGERFFVSTDGGSEQGGGDDFMAAIHRQAISYYDGRKPKRFEIFLARLITEFQSYQYFHDYWRHVKQLESSAVKEGFFSGL